MAKNFKYTKTVSDNMRIKGEVSADGKYIRCDNDGEEKVIAFDDIFSKFTGEIINFAVSTKEELDLSEEE